MSFDGRLISMSSAPKRRDPATDFDFLGDEAGPSYSEEGAVVEVDGVAVNLNRLRDPFRRPRRTQRVRRREMVLSGGPMTKSEFVDQVASRADLDKTAAAAAVDAVLETIAETLSRGSDVTFSGFGKFHVAERGARKGVHPRTGQPIQIAASRVPRFSAGSGLKKAINKG
jgi:DNA-binding protein HU-beta